MSRLSMKQTSGDELISYIAPAAPATRRPAEGALPFLRPEIGFTPKWFHRHLDINFDEKWHTDPGYRRQALLKMRAELRRRFPETKIGRIDQPDHPLDLVTGIYGAASVAAMYGIPIIYATDNWPNCAHQFLSAEEIKSLKPVDLENNPHFQALMNQVEQIALSEGRIEGYINWQGVLNNAQRLRGQDIFMDMITDPSMVNHLFGCLATTMIEAAKYLHRRQRQSGVDVRFFTVSNCLVNMVSAQHYEQFLLPRDLQIAGAFKTIGVHNCAWNANPYMDAYAKIKNLRYIDMGQESDLHKARLLFPQGRRAIMYTPMDIANKSLAEIRADLLKIADAYGPCDIVAADIEYGTPDQRVLDLIRICEEISEQRG